jgi:putative membrane protein
MRRSGLSWVAVAAITLILSGCSKTEGTSKTVTNAPASDEPGAIPGKVGTGGAGASVRSDDAFVRDVALKNRQAIELSHLALDKTSNPDIKSFAQRMVDDHRAAEDKLKSVVAGQAIDWPDQLENKQRDIADKLANTQGVDFDREYLKAIIDGHQDLTAKLESRLDVQSLADWKTAAAARTRSSGALPEPKATLGDVAVRPDKSDNPVTMKINQWAADTYPVAQKHLDAARTLENPTTKRSSN